MKNIASVHYNSGLMLSISKSNPTAFMLFMEWLAEHGPKHLLSIDKVSHPDKINIRFHGTRQSYQSAKFYINANL